VTPAAKKPSAAPGTRLNRWLAERGVASRRRADELIQGGAVEVNGETVLALGRRIVEGDRVRVEGRPVRDVPRLYYLFHKPKGVLCTEDPRETRPRVVDLVAGHVAGRVHAVGRLDEASEGLLLLTNDGEFANRVAHPRYGVPKTYVVRLSGSLAPEHLQKLRRGVHLADGKAVPMRIKVMRRTRQTTTLEVVLSEGRNRELRRMFARVGYGVRDLKRVRIGSLGLKGLPRGRVRPITLAEREALLKLSDETRKPRTSRASRPARKARPARSGSRARPPAGGRRK